MPPIIHVSLGVIELSSRPWKSNITLWLQMPLPHSKRSNPALPFLYKSPRLTEPPFQPFAIPPIRFSKSVPAMATDTDSLVHTNPGLHTAVDSPEAVPATGCDTRPSGHPRSTT